MIPSLLRTTVRTTRRRLPRTAAAVRLRSSWAPVLCRPAVGQSAFHHAAALSATPLTPAGHGRGIRLFSAAAAAVGPDLELVLDFVYKGLKAMEPHNGDNFVLTKDGAQVVLDLGAETGAFTLQPQGEDLAVMSPVSGVHIYRYDEATGTWLDQNDDHNMLQLLTSDVMYVCHGYPSF